MSGHLCKDAMSPLHNAASPLQDDGWYRDFEKVKDAMESMDNDLMMGQDVDTHRVNSLLRDLLSTENHSCVKRIHYYLDTKKIEADEETFGLMMNIYDERKEFVEANSILKKAKEYHLLPSADMYNFSIGGFFQMRDYKQGWVVYAQMISSGIKPTSETFSLLIRYCSKTEGETEKYMNMMQQQGVQQTVDTFGDAIDAFMAVGSVEKAKKVLKTTKLQESSLNEAKGTLVSSLAKFGHVDDAFDIYMETKGTLVSSLAKFGHVDDAFDIYMETKSENHHPLSIGGLDYFHKYRHFTNSSTQTHNLCVLKWVAQQCETFHLPNNVMSYLSTFKAMLACGETQIAEAISSNMDATHNDSYL